MSLFRSLFSKKERTPPRNKFEDHTSEIEAILEDCIGYLVRHVAEQFYIRHRYGETYAKATCELYIFRDTVLKTRVDNYSYEPSYGFCSEEAGKIIEQLPISREADEKTFWEACVPYAEKYLEQKLKQSFPGADFVTCKAMVSRCHPWINDDTSYHSLYYSFSVRVSK